ncbi:DUF262 domain-containing protein [Herbaspirillum sp. HC18]|nr:DUF262 domain-containing protein [Herbaspirillum sp. HC18]
MPKFETAAQNRRIGELIEKLNNETLIPRPDFQRRLVWTNADKNEFIRTVVMGYPFPEIYIAVAEVDVNSAASREALVDGQQRITTLHQYFSGSPAIKLDADIRAYAELSVEEKKEFLNYQIAVRHLGIVEDETIREVFKRINRTSYSLNKMERRNAEYQGEFKQVGTRLAQSYFFERYSVFSDREIRRMSDVVFALSIVITMLSTYFHRENEVQSYLEKYNDEFPLRKEIVKRFASVLRFLKNTRLPKDSRAWKKADLFVLICELDRLINLEKAILDPKDIGPILTKFYSQVDAEMKNTSGNELLQNYFKTTLQATADRSNRITRANVIRKVLTEGF